MLLTLKQDDGGQRLEAFLSGNLGAGVTLGLERKVDIFQLGEVPDALYPFLQLRGELVLVAD